MKTIKTTLTFLIVIFSLNCLAQSTTQVEYNFMSKGLKRVVEEGADMKAGYTMKKLFSQKFGNFSFQAVRILRSDLTTAGTVVVCDDPSFLGGRDYFVIPYTEAGSTPYGFQELYTSVNKFSEGKAQAFTKFLCVLYSKIYN